MLFFRTERIHEQRLYSSPGSCLLFPLRNQFINDVFSFYSVLLLCIWFIQHNSLSLLSCIVMYHCIHCFWTITMLLFRGRKTSARKSHSPTVSLLPCSVCQGFGKFCLFHIQWITQLWYCLSDLFIINVFQCWHLFFIAEFNQKYILCFYSMNNVLLCIWLT